MWFLKLDPKMRLPASWRRRALTFVALIPALHQPPRTGKRSGHALKGKPVVSAMPCGTHRPQLLVKERPNPCRRSVDRRMTGYLHDLLDPRGGQGGSGTPEQSGDSTIDRIHITPGLAEPGFLRDRAPDFPEWEEALEMGDEEVVVLGTPGILHDAWPRSVTFCTTCWQCFISRLDAPASPLAPMQHTFRLSKSQTIALQHACAHQHSTEQDNPRQHLACHVWS